MRKDHQKNRAILITKIGLACVLIVSAILLPSCGNVITIESPFVTDAGTSGKSVKAGDENVNVYFQNTESMAGFIGQQEDGKTDKITKFKDKLCGVNQVMEAIEAANHRIFGKKESKYYRLGGDYSSAYTEDQELEWQQTDDYDFYKSVDAYTVGLSKGKLESDGLIAMLFDKSAKVRFNYSDFNIIVTSLTEQKARYIEVADYLYKNIVSKDGYSVVVLAVKAGFYGKYSVVNVNGGRNDGKNEIVSEFTSDCMYPAFFVIMSGRTEKVTSYADVMAENLENFGMPYLDGDSFNSSKSACFTRVDVLTESGVMPTEVDYSLTAVPEKIEESDERRVRKVKNPEYDDNNKVISSVLKETLSGREANDARDVAIEDNDKTINMILSDAQEYFGRVDDTPNMFCLESKNIINGGNCNGKFMAALSVPLNIGDVRYANPDAIKKAIRDGQKSLSVDLKKIVIKAYGKLSYKDAEGNRVSETGWYKLSEDSIRALYDRLQLDVLISLDETYTEGVAFSLKVLLNDKNAIKSILKKADNFEISGLDSDSGVNFGLDGSKPVAITIPVDLLSKNGNTYSDPVPDWIRDRDTTKIASTLAERVRYNMGISRFYGALVDYNNTGANDDLEHITDVNLAVVLR